MTSRAINITLILLLTGLALALFILLPRPVPLQCSFDGQGESIKQELLYQRYQLSLGFQTSAGYLNRVATLEACLQPQNERKQQLLTLIQDLNIKSSSYAILNKVFFACSLVFAFCIISFPVIVSVVDKDSKAAKIFSPTQLPAITLLAGLCFGLYTDYKGKQTSTENLMRYVYAAPVTESLAEISRKVRIGLAEIDDGHDFSEMIKTEKP